MYYCILLEFAIKQIKKILSFYQLNSDIFNLIGLKHSVTSAYHPQTNGQDEKTNQTLKKSLMKYTNE